MVSLEQKVGKTKVPSHHDLLMSNFRGKLGLNNAFLTVGWPCIMYYAISPGFPYVFYDSKSQPNALSEICIITVCTMRISTVSYGGPVWYREPCISFSLSSHNSRKEL